MLSLRRSIGRFILVLAGLTSLTGGVALWINNRATSPSSAEKLEQSFERAASWMWAHRAEVLEDENPLLWWMVQSSAQQSGDARLQQLWLAYRQRYLDTQPDNIWASLLLQQGHARLSVANLDGLPDYNQLALYGASCNPYLGRRPEIRAQLADEYCARQWLAPACATHQLMGLYLLKSRGCRDIDGLDQTIDAVLARVERQASLDFRVVDVYLQRVLMLTLAGQPERVRPVWIERILAHQNADGGWSGNQMLMSFESGELRYGLSFTQRGLGWAQARSGFHATAQGVWLMSQLLARR